jgi:hypothetical protein
MAFEDNVPACLGAYVMALSSPPTEPPRALRALAHEPVVIKGRPHPSAGLGPSPPGTNHIVSSAVPPTCHKQRSRAVCSGQSRATPRRSLRWTRTTDLA